MIHIATDVLRQHVYPRITLPHIAAILLLMAGAIANLTFGISLGSDTYIGSFIGGGAGLGADIFNAVGLLIVVAAWRAGRRLQATLCGVVLAGTVLYSIQAGLGFVTGGRELKIGTVAAAEDTRTRLEASRSALQADLGLLGTTRSPGELKALSGQILADRRAGGCVALNGPYTREHCPKYFELQRELSRAEQIEVTKARLLEVDSKLEAFKTKSPSDPLGTAIVSYLSVVGFETTPERIRPWQSLLFVLIVVLGGPVTLWAAEDRISRKPDEPAKPDTTPKPDPAKEAEPKPDKKPDIKPDLKIVAKPAVVEVPVTAKPDKKPDKKPGIKPSKPPAKKRAAATPKVLVALKRNGGVIHSVSQRDLAESIGVSRSTLLRELGALESEQLVTVDRGDGVRVTLQ